MVKRSTRVAFLSEHASPLAVLGGEDSGGQNVYVDEVSRGLGKRGYAVDVFTRCGDPEAPDVVDHAPGVRVVKVKIGPPTFLLKDDLWPLMPDFRDAILRFVADTDVQYDIIHGHFWMSGWVAAELKERLGVPAVQIFHALGKTKRRHQGEADTSPDERISVEKDIIRRVDRIVAQCPAEWDQLVDDYGADPEKITMLPAGVDTDRFRPVPQDVARRRVGLEQDGFVVVYVGRMVRRKDVRNVVRAVAQLIERHERANGRAQPAITCLIVGGESPEPDPEITPEIGALQRLGAQLGISEHLIFTGNQQPDTLRNFYSAGDVAVTTPWYEPFGLTPLEAMACGRPVIGADVGGISFTVNDGETGFLVPPRDPEALADRLQQFMANPDLRRQMGAAARTRVEAEFSWQRVADRTDALYQRLLAAHRHRKSVAASALFNR